MTSMLAMFISNFIRSEATHNSECPLVSLSVRNGMMKTWFSRLLFQKASLKKDSCNNEHLEYDLLGPLICPLGYKRYNVHYIIGHKAFDLFFKTLWCLQIISYSIATIGCNRSLFFRIKRPQIRRSYSRNH